MLWPVLGLIGFLALMALVIALGTRSTKIYEAADQGRTSAVPPAAGGIGGERTTSR